MTLYILIIKQEFVKAVVSYQRKINSTSVTKPIKLDHTLLEKKRRVLVRSFSLAREIYFAKDEIHPSAESELKVGEEFLKKSSSSKFLEVFNNFFNCLYNYDN